MIQDWKIPCQALVLPAWENGHRIGVKNLKAAITDESLTNYENGCDSLCFQTDQIRPSECEQKITIEKMI